jgi:hypothetical protein
MYPLCEKWGDVSVRGLGASGRTKPMTAAIGAPRPDLKGVRLTSLTPQRIYRLANAGTDPGVTDCSDSVSENLAK